jgi:hypothetical protein
VHLVTGTPDLPSEGHRGERALPMLTARVMSAVVTARCPMLRCSQPSTVSATGPGAVPRHDQVDRSLYANCTNGASSLTANTDVGRSLNPPCVFPRNGLSTVSSVRWGAPPSRDWGLCCPCSGKRLMRTEARLYSSIPSAVGAGVVSTDVAPSPAVQFPKPTNHPVPHEVFQGAHGVFNSPLHRWDDPPN